MIIQYALKLVIPFLNLRARLQHRAGLRKDAISPAAGSLSKLYALIGDSRMLWRFWGLLPIYQWMTSLERMPPPTRKLMNIERLQGWSMLAYYPLEHLYYLRVNGLLSQSITLPFIKKKIHLDINKLGLWSTRFWALYVFLQFSHLREDFKLLKIREKALSKAKGKAKAIDETAEKTELASRWDALVNELAVNIGYLPLTLHWSLEKGLFDNEVWVGIFGLIAGVASFRSGWKATALPSSSQSAASDNKDEDEKKGVDVGVPVPSPVQPQTHTTEFDVSGSAW